MVALKVKIVTLQRYASVTLIEEMFVTKLVRIFYTRRITSRRPRFGAKYDAGAAILLRGLCTSQSLIVHTYGKLPPRRLTAVHACHWLRPW